MLQAAPLAGLAARVSGLGCAVAGLGWAYEAVADQQKSLYKMGLRAAGKEDELYTGGVWAASCPAPSRQEFRRASRCRGGFGRTWRIGLGI